MTTTGQDRLRRLRGVLADRSLDALFVGPGAELRYLTGYDAPPLERLTLLLVPAGGDPAMVVPELEEPRARRAGAGRQAELITWSEGEDPYRVVADLVADRGITGGRFAVQDRLWTVFALGLQEAVPATGWVAGAEAVGDLRVVKDTDELERLRAAGAAIDAAHRRVPELLSVGRTEAEIGADIADLIRAEHDEVAFVIVAAGPNGASPHHEPSDRPVGEGEPIVVDIGGVRDGYCSDCTRNYVLGDPPEGYVAMYEVVQQAQHAGVSAVAAGAAAEEVDAAARRVVADAGYGEAFIHRTGHGIGVEEHEQPWIVAGNRTPLREGMVFSVEPGIYLPGRYGARIEDIVAVTDGGAERLNTTSRGLVKVEP